MKKRMDPHRIYEQDQNKRYVEALLQMQSNINLASVSKKIQIIAITSGEEDDGKSTLACNLAYAYALKGSRVLLLDLDLRKSTDHLFYHIPREKGIVEYCIEECTLEEVIKPTKYNVDVITAGKHTSFPIELIQSPKLKTLMEELKQKYDYIIVDTPPVLCVTDALVAAPFIEGYVLTARQKKSKVSCLKEANKLLLQNGVFVIGCALTDISTKSGYYYYYGK